MSDPDFHERDCGIAGGWPHSVTDHEERSGAFGTVRDILGDPLTEDEVAALPDNTKVVVIWSGGNGPWEYLVIQDGPYPYAVPERHINEEWARLYNPLRFIGAERYHTRVWLGELNEETVIR